MFSLTPEQATEWKATCRKQRDIARCNPSTCPEMSSCMDYDCTCGPYNLRIVLERYMVPSSWHGSISYMPDIGEQTVYDKVTGLPIFDVPKQGMIKVKEWKKEEYDTARDLLGELFGPLIHDEHQQVVETSLPDGFCLHWLVREEDTRHAIPQEN